MSELCNVTNDNTLHSSNEEQDLVLRNFESDLSNVLAWFNSLKANPGKFGNKRK